MLQVKWKMVEPVWNPSEDKRTVFECEVNKKERKKEQD